MTNPITKLLDSGVQLTGITSDSREVKQGNLFIAYKGDKSDGRDHIAEAINNGAAAVIWEQEGFTWNSELKIPNISIFGLRNSAGFIADGFYGQPSSRLWMIGVTGTNGKSSCSHWIAQAMNSLERRAAVIGTLGNGFVDIPNTLSEAVNTTPDPILIQKLLAEYLKKNAKTIVMEVSSHGLDQGRVNGVHFDVALFTNLSRDHLDYHKNMESYENAKRKLFTWDGLRCAVLNIDDPVGSRFNVELVNNGKSTLTYGLHGGDVRGFDVSYSREGIKMKISSPFGEVGLELPVIGKFNAYNLLAVYATLLASDVPYFKAAQAMHSITSVPGRMQQFGGVSGPLIVIDYAHSPDALEKALQALSEITEGKLICVFGCGGDRDKGKRLLMGQVASSYADEIIVTSDNPRYENPNEIVEQIIAGISKNYQRIEDRRLAIADAIKRANIQDVVLIAGKGHENYQDIEGVKYDFNDALVVEEFLKEGVSQ